MRKIIRNAIRCNHCGDVIESTYRHEYAETWMNAKKALELGFCDEIMYQPEAEQPESPEDSFVFSSRKVGNPWDFQVAARLAQSNCKFEWATAVTNCLLDKLKAKIPEPEQPKVRVSDLEKRLALLKY